MTTQSTAAPYATAVGLVERSIGYTRFSLSWVSSTELSAPTPCRDWDLRALLVHMDDSLAALTEAARGSGVRLDAAHVPVPQADLVERVCRRACTLLGAWVRAEQHAQVRVGGAAMSTKLLLAAGALEITVHGWDVAQACGVPHPIPAELAADLREYLPMLVCDADRPSRFAAAVEPVPGASAADRLLALLGRAGWSGGR